MVVDGVLASVPLVVVLFLMVGRQWPAAPAGALGLGTAFLLAETRFGDSAAGDGVAQFAVGTMSEALFSAAMITWIVVAALCIYELQLRSGGMDRIQDAIASISGDPRIKVLLVAWFFALFLEGAAGFGTPIALAAPLLVTIGLRPVDAVATALLGHAVGVSFGAIGTPVITQSTITGVDAASIARMTALYHAAIGGLMVWMVFRLSASASMSSTAPGRSGLWFGLGGAAFLAPYFGLAVWLGPELPTLGGAILGLAVFAGVLALVAPRSKARVEASASPTARDDHALAMPLARAAAPYLVLTGLVALTRGVPWIKETLQRPAVEWVMLGEFSGSVEPFYHPGTLLLVAFVCGGLFQRTSLYGLASAAVAASIKVGPAAVALVATLGMSRMMVHGGMIDALAILAAAYGAGSWPLMAPLVGVLGTFTTGSATASNVLFSDFQQDTAARLNLPVVEMLGAQTAAAGVGNVVAPHNIIAGGATVGLAGKEGAVLRKTAIPCAVYATACGLLSLLMARR
ncbi:MAG: L-lactate permease [Dehalococcoidia bacterium]